MYVHVCVRGFAGVRTCMYVYASIPTYICTCVRAHVRTRDRARVCAQLRLCEGSHVCVCVRARARVCERLHVRSLVGACVVALTGHVCAYLKLCMCMCMHVHVRAGVGAHACAFAGVGQRTCGVFAYVGTSLYACMIIISYYYICRLSVYVRVCVRVWTYVHANICLCADECVYTSARVWGCSCACMCVHYCLHVRACALASVGLRL